MSKVVFMELMKFGNWSVSPYGIDWHGRPDIQLSIALGSLTQTGLNKQSILYHWLIACAEDERFTAEDIYSLNTAFFYALDLFRAELEVPSYVLIAETLMAQQNLINLRSPKTVNSAYK
jgi:hypothetical protein